VPEQIAIGDEISLTYGSNTKTYVFHVVRIRQKGNSCAIWSERSGPSGEDEKLEIGQCRSARRTRRQGPIDALEYASTVQRCRGQD